MQLNIESFITSFQRLNKAKKWERILLLTQSGKIFLLFDDNGDFYKAEVGESDADFCLEAKPDFSSVCTLLKNFKDNIANLTLKKDKLIISNSKENIKFSLAVNNVEHQMPDIIEKDLIELNLEIDKLQYIVKFCGFEYPANMVHLDLTTGGIFATDTSKIISYVFKEKSISIDRDNAQLLQILNQPVKINAGQDKLFSSNNLSFTIFQTPPDIDEYLELIKKPKNNFILVNKEDFVDTFQPHASLGHPSVVIECHDKQLRMRSAIESESALQTSIMLNKEKELKTQFKVKDISNLLPLLSSEFCIGLHPDHENIFCIFDSLIYFAAI